MLLGENDKAGGLTQEHSTRFMNMWFKIFGPLPVSEGFVSTSYTNYYKALILYPLQIRLDQYRKVRVQPLLLLDARERKTCCYDLEIRDEKLIGNTSSFYPD